MIPHPGCWFDNPSRSVAATSQEHCNMWRKFFTWLLSTVAPILVQQAAEKVAKAGEPKPPAQ